MKLKKVLLPFITGSLALGLAARSGEEKADKNETPKEQEPIQTEMKSAEEIQKKLTGQLVEYDQVVAVVNNEELKGEQYNVVLIALQSQMQQRGQDPTSDHSAEQLKGQALNMIVNQTLLHQSAKEEEISASESEIDEDYSLFVEQFGNEEKMKEALKSRNMDVGMIREKIAKSIVIEKYQEKVAPVEIVTEEEIKEYYDEAVAATKDSSQELPPLDEISEDIKGYIEQERQQKKLSAYIEELKADAEIELKI